MKACSQNSRRTQQVNHVWFKPETRAEGNGVANLIAVIGHNERSVSYTRDLAAFPRVSSPCYDDVYWSYNNPLLYRGKSPISNGPDLQSNTTRPSLVRLRRPSGKVSDHFVGGDRENDLRSLLLVRKENSWKLLFSFFCLSLRPKRALGGCRYFRMNLSTVSGIPEALVRFSVAAVIPSVKLTASRTNDHHLENIELFCPSPRRWQLFVIRAGYPQFIQGKPAWIVRR